MKLATVIFQGRSLVVAQVDADLLYPLNQFVLSDGSQINDMQDIIQGGMPRIKELQALLKQADLDDDNVIPVAQVQWLPPVPNPGKICGVAMNNSASNSRKIKAPEHPAFFLKPTSCLIGHLQDIEIRSYYGSVHPEPELAVIIGKKTKDVVPEQVAEHIFGYSIFNDITGNGMRAEDLFQYYALYPKRHNPDELERIEQHLSYAARYKGTDTFGVLGPWLVTADDITNPDDLDVFCSIRDERISDDNTRYYNYKVAEVISFLSYFHTLNPGDVVSMGTAFKPGSTRKSIHHANFLQVGGPVSVEISGLGRQENPVKVIQQELGRWRLISND